MGWIKDFFRGSRKSPEEKERELKKLNNKENTHERVETLINICNDLMDKVNAKDIHRDDEIFNASIKKVKTNLESTKAYLEQAHLSIKVINPGNINLILKELNEAYKAISSLEDNVIRYIFRLKSDRRAIVTIKSDLNNLIISLPKVEI